MSISLLPINHGCRRCAEVSLGYSIDEEGVKRCSSCSGRVYFLQEAFDLIRDLDLQITPDIDEGYDDEDDLQDYA
jgi:hypothetical protein